MIKNTASTHAFDWWKEEKDLFAFSRGLDEIETVAHCADSVKTSELFKHTIHTSHTQSIRLHEPNDIRGDLNQTHSQSNNKLNA